MSVVHLTLYVAGAGTRARSVEAQLRALCERWLPARYEIRVVDVTTDAERAEAARVLTTPTLVKEAPAPVRRVTGDFSDPDRLWDFLDVEAAPSPD